MQYAVLDIEATNGAVGEERIIEIAIFQYDGATITDQFISLVNPQVPIDAMVQKLTGITNKMVRTAPKFHEIAKRILEITNDTILVGHNVGFDSRMLVQEFARLGYYDFKKTQIDTLPISQQLLPDEDSHSLGKLCKSLGIPLTGRHRAAGDAKATLELFQLLKEKDSEKKILSQANGTLNTVGGKTPLQLNEDYLHLIEPLPNTIGVFYFLNKKGKVIYLQKSKNIKQQVIQHFTGKKKFHDQIREQTKRIDFELTGNLMVASIKELHELKQLKPYHNKYRRPKENTYYGIFFKEEEGNYFQFKIEEIKSRKQIPFFWFETERLAKEFLYTFTREHGLCLFVNGLGKQRTGCFLYTLNQCNGACLGKEEVDVYNQRVTQWKQGFEVVNDDFMVIGKGNQTHKHSFIWVQKRTILGYGFFDYHYQITDKEKRMNRLTKVIETSQMNYKLFSYLQTLPKEKLLDISN